MQIDHQPESRITHKSLKLYINFLIPTASRSFDQFIYFRTDIVKIVISWFKAHFPGMLYKVYKRLTVFVDSVIHPYRFESVKSVQIRNKVPDKNIGVGF